MKAIPRRTVLRGLGVCLGLPLLDAMLPGVSHSSYAADSQFTPIDRSAGVQPRAIFCYIPNGVNILEWVPKATGRGYELSPTLQVLEEHRKNFTVLSGLGHPASKGGHSGADTWLTGADLTSVPGSDYSNSVSIDQVIAARHGTSTRFSSLQLSDMSGTGAAGHSHTLSFNASGTPIPAENSPRRLFERLFVPDTAADRAATLQRYAQKKSVLDSVLQDANRLRSNLSPSDQQKLDQYLQSVRETEDRVERLESWIDVPKPAVDSKMLQLASQPNNAHDRPMWIDVMMELCYLAFAHDATRVITFEWSREAGGYGGSGEKHHEFSHHGGDEGMLKKLAAIDRFHLSKLARFLDLLKKTGDGDGQMLDHTMVMFGSGMNSGTGGEHSPKNLPLLIAGGNRFGFQHDQHLAFDADRHPPLSNLLLTIGQKMGLETDAFSDASGRLEL
ncbi:MAG: DUF1552 domain-containing protein [Pirellula sp.]|jgi:hypothetical protein|nr:DUF1552 domain-containing protein [Pirellula sp.]